jgi:transcriptional regulator with XRE-family HTH domain
MSQGDLGAAVGITFQQVQKYENGKDRVAASTLQGIAAALGVHPGSFFDSDTPVPIGSIPNVKAAMRAADAFQHIRDPRVLKQLVALARELATPPAAVEQPAPAPEETP